MTLHKLIFASIGMLSIVSAIAANGRAETITLAQDSTLNQLLGGDPTWSGPLTTTDMSSGNLHSQVFSQAFQRGGWYAYLYQVDNTGIAGNSSAELFSLGKFAGSVTDGHIGYLTDTALPTGFSAGGQNPENDGYIDDTISDGLEISFYYSKKSSHSITPGHDSRVMFIVSDLSPGTVVGNVIDGAVATGPVVGAVPEPGTIVLLGTAALGALAYAWRRRRAI